MKLRLLFAFFALLTFSTSFVLAETTPAAAKSVTVTMPVPVFDMPFLYTDGAHGYCGIGWSDTNPVATAYRIAADGKQTALVDANNPIFSGGVSMLYKTDTQLTGLLDCNSKKFLLGGFDKDYNRSIFLQDEKGGFKLLLSPNTTLNTKLLSGAKKTVVYKNYNDSLMTEWAAGMILAISDGGGPSAGALFELTADNDTVMLANLTEAAGALGPASEGCVTSGYYYLPTYVKGMTNGFTFSILRVSRKDGSITQAVPTANFITHQANGNAKPCAANQDGVTFLYADPQKKVHLDWLADMADPKEKPVVKSLLSSDMLGGEVLTPQSYFATLTATTTGEVYFLLYNGGKKRYLPYVVTVQDGKIATPNLFAPEGFDVSGFWATGDRLMYGVWDAKAEDGELLTRSRATLATASIRARAGETARFDAMGFDLPGVTASMSPFAADAKTVSVGMPSSAKPGSVLPLTITLNGVEGKQTLTAEIGVIAPLMVDSFTTQTSDDGQIKLVWSVTGADEVSIDQNIGKVDKSSGSVTIKPAITTTYTLSAMAFDGKTATAKVTVTPPPPAVTGVTAPDGSQVVPGTFVILTGTNLAEGSAEVPMDPLDSVPTELAGTQVLANGEPTKVSRVSPTQIMFFLPQGLEGDIALTVTRKINNATVASLPLKLSLTAPAAVQLPVE